MSINITETSDNNIIEEKINAENTEQIDTSQNIINEVEAENTGNDTTQLTINLEDTQLWAEPNQDLTSEILNPINSDNIENNQFTNGVAFLATEFIRSGITSIATLATSTLVATVATGVVATIAAPLLIGAAVGMAVHVGTAAYLNANTNADYDLSEELVYGAFTGLASGGVAAFARLGAASTAALIQSPLGDGISEGAAAALVSTIQGKNPNEIFVNSLGAAAGGVIAGGLLEAGSSGIGQILQSGISNAKKLQANASLMWNELERDFAAFDQAMNGNILNRQTATVSIPQAYNRQAPTIQDNILYAKMDEPEGHLTGGTG